MRRISFPIFFLLCLSNSVFAETNAATGLYLGGDLVVSKITSVKGSAFGSNIFDTVSYAKPFIGYRFNDNIGLELGYNNFKHDSNHYDYDASISDSYQLGPDHYRLYAVDLALKVIRPFESGWSIFGKGGVAYTHQSVYNQTYTIDIPSANSNASLLLPLVGIGVSYNFTEKWACDLSFTHFQGRSIIHNIDMLGMGLSYTFSST